MHPLDNPTWNALTTLQRSVSLGNELARRFVPSIAPFAGVADFNDPACWNALAEVIGTDAIVGVLVISKNRSSRRMDRPPPRYLGTDDMHKGDL